MVISASGNLPPQGGLAVLIKRIRNFRVWQASSCGCRAAASRRHLIRRRDDILRVLQLLRGRACPPPGTHAAGTPQPAC